MKGSPSNAIFKHDLLKDPELNRQLDGYMERVVGPDLLARLKNPTGQAEVKLAPKEGQRRAEVERLAETPWGRSSPGRTWLRFGLHEGRKRQIRRMCATIDHPVRRLIRVRIGPIELGDLPPGRYRALTQSELEGLRAETGLR